MKSEITELLLARFDTLGCNTCKWYNKEENRCDGNSCEYQCPAYSISREYAEKLEEEIMDIIHNKMLGI